MTRKQRLVAASVAIALLALWALLTFWVGPAEIARAHRGESLPFLNGVLSGGATHPLQDYLDSWTRLTTGTGWLLAGAILVGYAMAELLSTGLVRRWRQKLAARILAADAAARRTSEATDLRFVDGLLLALAIGVAAGAIEGFLQFINLFVLGNLNFQIGPVGPEVVWLVPLVTGALFLVTGAALWLLLRHVWPRVVRSSFLVLPLLTLALFEVSRASFPRIAWWAVAVLAVGIAARAALAIGGVSRRRIRRLSVLCIVALLVAGSGAAARTYVSDPQPSGVAPDDSPNLLFIILDTVRSANLSVYGYQRPTTPVLERLVERAITFDMAFVPGPWTLPSHASFFTGRHPYELSVDWLTPLDDTFPTVAEWFGQHGYATGGFVANMTVCGPQFGLARGFQHYEAARPSWRTALSNTWGTREIIKIIRERMFEHRGLFVRKTAEEVGDAFLSWQADLDRPFFAFLNYFEAHNPYGPPHDSLRVFSVPGEKYWLAGGGRGYDEDDTRQVLNAYDDGIHYIDAQIGRMLDELDRREVLENTIVVISSDHGEEFREHGGFGHATTVYREVLHVPLLIVPAGAARSGVRITSPVGLRRIAATLVVMAGLEDGSPFPGLPLVSQDADPYGEHLPVLSESTAKPAADEGEFFSLIDEGYHYIIGDGRQELYDLAADTLEAQDLASDPRVRGRIESMQATLDQLTGGLTK